jgi:riboflavin kinase/FMN adenylyltransferase
MLMQGKVVRGKGRGRVLGFPTANLEILELEKLLKPGIYAAKARFKGKSQWYIAAVHAGPRPTVSDLTPVLEVHLLDFPDRNLYEKRLEVKELVYIRAIKKFASLEELTQAIKEDCEKVREIYPAA